MSGHERLRHALPALDHTYCRWEEVRRPFHPSATGLPTDSTQVGSLGERRLLLRSEDSHRHLTGDASRTESRTRDGRDASDTVATTGN